MTPALLLLQHSREGGFVLGGLCLLYALVFAFAIGALALWIWMLVDCATRERSEGNDKIVWILVIALTGFIGALIYLIVRRPQRMRELGR